MIDKDHWVAVVDMKGVKIDITTGKGPLNNMASDTKIVLFGDKTGAHYFGYIVLQDNDGDKMVWQVWDTPAGGPNKGAGKIVAGTGKYEGAEGTITDEDINVRGYPEGTWQNVGKCIEKITLKKPPE